MKYLLITAVISIACTLGLAGTEQNTQQDIENTPVQYIDFEPLQIIVKSY